MAANHTNTVLHNIEEKELSSTESHFSRTVTVTPTPAIIVNKILNSVLTTLTPSNYCCINVDNSSPGINLENQSTTGATFTVTDSVHNVQRNIWSLDEFDNYLPYEEQNFTPTWLIVLNVCLIIFLVVVLGVAVYPAVRKYCDSTYFLNARGRTRYWIEDNEEVSILTPNIHIPECSFALLNHNRTVRQMTADSNSAPSVDIFVETNPDSTKQCGD